MRLRLALFFGATMALGGIAQAQTATGASLADSKGYVEGVAQSAFGNQTNQSYGVEAGIRIPNGLQAFAEFGRARDVAPSTMSAGAQTIASFLTRTQTGTVSFTAKEPASFGLAGVKYMIPVNGKASPYVLGGFGGARLTRDVHFLIAGADVTAVMAQYGVVLGSDLAGDSTRAMMSLGGGVAWPLWQHMVVDFQYRYGRIFAPVQGINLNRAGVGIGVRF